MANPYQFLALVAMFILGFFTAGPMWIGNPTTKEERRKNLLLFVWALLWCGPPLVLLFIKGVFG